MAVPVVILLLMVGILAHAIFPTPRPTRRYRSGPVGFTEGDDLAHDDVASDGSDGGDGGGGDGGGD